MERMRFPVKDILVLRSKKMTEVLQNYYISNKLKIVQFRMFKIFKMVR